MQLFDAIKSLFRAKLPDRDEAEIERLTTEAMVEAVKPDHPILEAALAHAEKILAGRPCFGTAGTFKGEGALLFIEGWFTLRRDEPNSMISVFTEHGGGLKLKCGLGDEADVTLYPVDPITGLTTREYPDHPKEFLLAHSNGEGDLITNLLDMEDKAGKCRKIRYSALVEMAGETDKTREWHRVPIQAITMWAQAGVPVDAKKDIGMVSERKPYVRKGVAAAVRGAQEGVAMPRETADPHDVGF